VESHDPALEKLLSLPATNVKVRDTLFCETSSYVFNHLGWGWREGFVARAQLSKALAYGTENAID
jgi:hypothetical protein